ncbi:MAG: tetratricopeptide repeat protein [Planctomycetes bacterium]|nr:tetratricopeptide repeat protein [Planctomycetota bacterium]
MASLSGSLLRMLEALRFGEDLERLGHLIRRRLGDLSPAALPHGPPRAVPELDELLEGSDDKRLDLAYAASLLAWEDAPHAVDVPRVVARVHTLGDALRVKLAGQVEPLEQLAIANAFLFGELGWEASSPRERKGGENRLGDLLLPYVLERKRGHCLGLSTAYLAVAQRAGLPVFGVSVPGHFFVRYDDGRAVHNVETTARGAALSDAHYVSRFGVGEELVRRGVYLQNLSRREVLSEVLNNRANVYWDRGDPERAARDLDRVTRVSHGFSRARLGRGFMAKVRGDFARARRELDAALAIEPDLARAELLLGEIHLELGELEQAQARFQRAAEGLDNPLALTNLGRVDSRRGDYPSAIVWHERALKADPGCHVAWNNLGVAQLGLGLRREAIESFTKARALAPDFLPAAENLLHARRRGGPVGLAQRALFGWICRRYEEAIESAPRHDRLRGRYVRFLLECGAREERASLVAREGLALGPTVRGFETLALVRKHQRQPTEAARLLAQALELDASRGGHAQARLRALIAAAQASAATE